MWEMAKICGKWLKYVRNAKVYGKYRRYVGSG